MKSKDRSTQSELWRRGIIGAWKCDSTQLDVVKELHTKLETHRRVVLLEGRRMGKTFMLVVEALEFAIKNPASQIKFISSTTTSIIEFILPIFHTLIEDCPADITPTWLKNEAAFRFANGSRIKLFGTDSKNFRKLRGQVSHLTILDEAGFMSDLTTTVTSVLSPQALTTRGRMIISSTASTEPGHDFTELVIKARADGACIERTIYDRLALGSHWGTAEEEAAENARRLKDAIADCGGETTSAFRREYLNDLGATDSTRAAMPYITDALCRGTKDKPGIVRDVKRPDRCHKYVGGDLGFIDQSAFCFGWLAPGNPQALDPKEIIPGEAPAGAVVIEDELVLLKTLSSEMKPFIADVEKRNWSGEAPVVRAVDGTPEQIEQLWRTGIEIHKTTITDPETAIDEVQKLAVKGLLIIHPRCVRLVACMQAAVWQKAGKKLDRHPVHGHFDLMMALCYLVRNLRRHASPYPYGHDSGPMGPGPGGAVSDTVKALRQGFAKRQVW